MFADEICNHFSKFYKSLNYLLIMNFSMIYQKAFVFCCLLINTMAILRMVHLDFALIAVTICLLMTNSVHELLIRNDKRWRLLYFVLTALVLITSQYEAVQQDPRAKIPLKVSDTRMLNCNFCYAENMTAEIEKFQRTLSSMKCEQNDQAPITRQKVPDEQDLKGEEEEEEVKERSKLYFTCAVGILTISIAVLGTF
jgi:hypothetical protein